jgi:hypothetical protein
MAGTACARQNIQHWQVAASSNSRGSGTPHSGSEGNNSDSTHGLQQQTQRELRQHRCQLQQQQQEEQ